MANRNTTYTSEYSRRGYVPPSDRQQPQQQQAQQQQYYAPQQQTQPPVQGQQAPGYPIKDLLMLGLILFVIPLIGIVGVFFRPFLWVFVIVSAISLAVLWVGRCFAQGSRVVISIILLALSILSLVAAVGLAPKEQEGFPSIAGSGTVLDDTNTGGSGLPQVGFPSIADNTATGDGADGTTPDWASLNQQTGEQQNSTGLTGGEADNGSVDPNATPVPVLGGVPGSEQTQGPTNIAVMDARVALEGYLKAWTTHDFAEMVKYTLPSWRQVQDNANQQLYWMHTYWFLNGWTITNETTSPAADSVTFMVVTDLQRDDNAKTPAKQQYTALVIQSGDGMWYVDPDSMRSGIAITETPPPQENQVAAEPTAAPDPTVDPSTTLWYNSKSGERYHTQEKCPSIGQKYYQYMKSFKYSQLNDSDFRRLNPCSECEAPSRPKE